MQIIGCTQILVFFGLVLLLTKPMGLFMFRVFEGRAPWPRVLGRVESALFRMMGVDPSAEQDWKGYTAALLGWSAVGIGITFSIASVQHILPLNPQGLPGLSPALAFNTAVSFVTNTNWQSYAGETTISYLTQMVGLTWHNFMSAAAGMAVALAVARGFTRKNGPDGPVTLGNFWVDLVRATVYVLIPLSLLSALLMLAMGVIQTFAPYLDVTTLEGGKQVLALGPVASQEAIKQLGTNGGGFFNANSAHPFENPTPLSNLLQLVLIFLIPAGLTYTFGRMASDQRQGWAIWAAMAGLFLIGVTVAYSAEAGDNPLLQGLGLQEGVGNLEGKETRFGIAASALFATVTTDASCGAVNSMHDSFTPLGGLVTLANMLLGEVVFGGVGSGLYGILVSVVLTVFLAGLMVGRTPEYLGKKIEATEVKYAMLYSLVFPLLILGFGALAAGDSGALASLNNSGPHGLSEFFYAGASAAANNGSAFAGLNANTPFWNIGLGLVMLGGRFLMIVPVMAIAGGLVGKRVAPPGVGTFPTGGGLFAGLLVTVIVVVGALTFLPAVTLGPVLEHVNVMGGILR